MGRKRLVCDGKETIRLHVARKALPNTWRSGREVSAGMKERGIGRVKNGLDKEAGRAVSRRGPMIPVLAALLLSGCVSSSDPALVSTSGFAPGIPDTANLETVAAVSAEPQAAPADPVAIAATEPAAAPGSPLPTAAPVNALAQGITQTAPAQAVNNLYAAPAAQTTAIPPAPAPERFGDRPSATDIAGASAVAADAARAPDIAQAAVPIPAPAPAPTSATEPAVVAAPTAAAVEQPTVQLAAVAPPQKQSGFFSKLFASNPKPPKAVPNTAKAPAERRQISLSPRSGNAAPLPGVNTSSRKLFGIGDGEGEDDENGYIEVASAAGLARLAPNGLRTQTEKVDVACLKPKLVRMLKSVEKHYGRPVVVTSGYRSPNYNRRVGGASGSKHTTCEAADIQIDGVTKWQLAKYLRSRPDRGGVGTYCHTESVHVDIGSSRDWNWRCRRRK